jgi:TonB family protein
MPASLRSDYPLNPIATAGPFCPDWGATFTGLRTPGMSAAKVDVDCAPYVRSIERVIKRHWLASTNEKRCTVHVRLKILPNGKLAEEPQIEFSSGNSKADQAALDAVRKSAPFSPTPPLGDSEFLGILLKFNSVDFRKDGGIHGALFTN